MSWLGTWSNRLKLTIDSDRIDDDLSNFPLFITLTSGSGRTSFDATVVFDELSTSGTEYKIAITDSTGTNQLPIEIEQWDLANEVAGLWTKVPTIVSGTDTVLYLYYDSSQLDNNLWVGYTGSAIAETVWTSEIVAAYHINTLPESIAYMRDSTQAHDATHYGSLVNSSLISSKTGLGYDFDGSDDRLEAAHAGSLALATFSFVTIFKSDSIGTTQTLLSKNRDNVDVTVSYNCNYEIRIDSSKLRFRWENSAGADFGLYINQTLQSDTWYHAVCTFNNDTDYVAIYINGYLDNSTSTAVVPNTSNTQPLRIGNMYSNTGGHTYFFNGVIDEVDVINEDKPPAWIKAHYFSTFDDLITYTPTPVFTASGIVNVDGTPTDDIYVRLYRRSTGQLVGETTTFSGGLFEIETPYNELHYIMAMYTTSSTNAVIYDWIEP
jgi:hypothetical protein